MLPQVDDIEALGPATHLDGLLEPLRSQPSWQIAASLDPAPTPSLLSTESLSSSPSHSPLRAALQAQTLRQTASPSPAPEPMVSGMVLGVHGRPAPNVPALHLSMRFLTSMQALGLAPVYASSTSVQPTSKLRPCATCIMPLAPLPACRACSAAVLNAALCSGASTGDTPMAEPSGRENFAVQLPVLNGELSSSSLQPAKQQQRSPTRHARQHLVSFESHAPRALSLCGG